PLSDVASMIRSFYYAGYEGFLSSPHIKHEEVHHLLHYADIWIHYMNNFFLKSYLDTVKNSQLIPGSPEDLKVMLQNYLLERALYAMEYELHNRPERVVIPLAMIRDILN
ncbi:MAG TPA: hypothetical protein VK588_12880, partial [Chitinophagaceae bacterium]|nr:hypothetical protein [Chitinophagaceae bacterium]